MRRAQTYELELQKQCLPFATLKYKERVRFNITLHVTFMSSYLPIERG